MCVSQLTYAGNLCFIIVALLRVLASLSWCYRRPPKVLTHLGSQGDISLERHRPTGGFVLAVDKHGVASLHVEDYEDPSKSLTVCPAALGDILKTASYLS